MKNKNENENEKEKEPKEEEKEKEKEKEIEISRQVIDIGNVFQDSKTYFEYVFRKDLLEKQEFKDLKEVIFQVQIHYLRPDGAKMLRVITQKKAISQNKEEVLKNLNMDVLAANASRKSARLCEQGDYEMARANIYGNALWMNRNAINEDQVASTETYMTSNMNFDDLMQRQQVTENTEHVSFATKEEKKRSQEHVREMTSCRPTCITTK